VSFSSATYLTFPPPAFGWRWNTPISAARTGCGHLLSLLGRRSTVVLATLLGTLAALGIARLPRALRVVAAGLILSPLIVPVIVVAIGIYYALALRAGRLAIGLVLAYLPRCSFRRDQRQRQPGGIDPRLEQAALSSAPRPAGRSSR